MRCRGFGAEVEFARGLHGRACVLWPFPMGRSFQVPFGDDFAVPLFDRCTQMKDWPESTRELTSQFRNLRGGAAEVMKAFSAIAQAALSGKALDQKTKELIALAIAVAVRCDDCIGIHVMAGWNRERPRRRCMRP
jgi:hypothetical protein